MRLGVEAAIVDGVLLPGDVEVEDGVVAAVALDGTRGSGLAVPGFVDLQVNGFGGVDFAAADSAAYRKAGEALLETGVTAFQPTLVTAPEASLVASLRAVPAFIRVDPAMTSGPTTADTTWSATAASSGSGTQTTATVSAPTARAARPAPRTYGVRPLAESSTTVSFAPTPAERTSAAPASPSSSAASCATASAATPPATRTTTCSGGTPNVGPHSAASTAASLPEEPAPT